MQAALSARGRQKTQQQQSALRARAVGANVSLMAHNDCPPVIPSTPSTLERAIVLLGSRSRGNLGKTARAELTLLVGTYPDDTRAQQWKTTLKAIRDGRATPPGPAKPQATETGHSPPNMSALVASRPQLERAIVLLGARSRTALNPQSRDELTLLMGKYPSADEAEEWKRTLKSARDAEVLPPRIPDTLEELTRTLELLHLLVNGATLPHAQQEELRELLRTSPRDAREALVWHRALSAVADDELFEEP